MLPHVTEATRHSESLSREPANGDGGVCWSSTKIDTLQLRDRRKAGKCRHPHSRVICGVVCVHRAPQPWKDAALSSLGWEVSPPVLAKDESVTGCSAAQQPAWHPGQSTWPPPAPPPLHERAVQVRGARRADDEEQLQRHGRSLPQLHDARQIGAPPVEPGRAQCKGATAALPP